MKNIPIRGTIFSDDRKHRFVLFRGWNPDKPGIQFIGLNPSTADENNNDPTIRRVIQFSKDFGFGYVLMTNLFSYITPNPRKLIMDNNKDNDEHLFLSAGSVQKIVCCWGNFQQAVERGDDVYFMLTIMGNELYCLGQNQNGTPKHPLYVKSNSKLQKFNL